MDVDHLTAHPAALAGVDPTVRVRLSLEGPIPNPSTVPSGTLAAAETCDLESCPMPAAGPASLSLRRRRSGRSWTMTDRCPLWQRGGSRRSGASPRTEHGHGQTAAADSGVQSRSRWPPWELTVCQTQRHRASAPRRLPVLDEGGGPLLGRAEVLSGTARASQRGQGHHRFPLLVGKVICVRRSAVVSGPGVLCHPERHVLDADRSRFKNFNPLLHGTASATGRLLTEYL